MNPTLPRRSLLRRRLSIGAVGLALIAGVGVSIAAETIDVWVDLQPPASDATDGGQDARLRCVGLSQRPIVVDGDGAVVPGHTP